MSDTLATLLTRVKANVTRTDKDDEIQVFLNEAQRSLAQLPIPWQDLQTISDVTTTADTETTDWPSDYLRALSLTLQDGSSSRLILPMDGLHADEVSPRPEANSTDRPRFYIERQGQFEWRPIPDDVYTISVWHIAWPTELSDDSDTATFSRADDVLVASATAKLYDSVENYEAGGVWWKRYDRALSSMIRAERAQSDSVTTLGAYGTSRRTRPRRNDGADWTMTFRT